jgi:hypothetical protein
MWAIAMLVAVTACSPSTEGSPAAENPTSSTAVTTSVAPEPATTTTSTSTTTTSTTTTTVARFPVLGRVVDGTGEAMPGVTVAIDGQVDLTDDDGSFLFEAAAPGPMTATRPAWLPTTVDWDGSNMLEVTIEPRVVRALRASKYVAADDVKFAEVLDHAVATTVNALVFDTKDESGFVLYESGVDIAGRLESVLPMYDPESRIDQAHEAGLYAITRIVTFEDAVWTERDPTVKLAGRWVDPRDEANWVYPLALAVEACELGFDEIQFDYVRFPAGRSAAIARASSPTTPEERVATIEAFLVEAASRLHPLGCAVSADVFAIVFSAGNEQGIGQRPEELSAHLDAISPMIYPSHYSSGWLGFDDPNAHPGVVTARALDDGGPRVAHPALIRPWLQAFYYDADQVLAGIAEAEARGHGWMLWNSGGEYARSWLPPADGSDNG